MSETIERMKKIV